MRFKLSNQSLKNNTPLPKTTYFAKDERITFSVDISQIKKKIGTELTILNSYFFIIKYFL